MRIDCLETPALLVDRDALDRNMERMRLILEKSGVALRPHYKSHKSTAIAHLQIQAGSAKRRTWPWRALRIFWWPTR